MDKKEKPHGYALRKGRISIPTQLYSITTVTKSRQPFFQDFYAARTVIRILKSRPTTDDAKTLCFVVMPDHLHWLMELKNKNHLSATVQSVKSRISKTLGQSVWQKGFHDRAIRRDEDIIAIARYIVANPLRAGLVKSLREYPHWDAIWL